MRTNHSHSTIMWATLVIVLLASNCAVAQSIWTYTAIGANGSYICGPKGGPYEVNTCGGSKTNGETSGAASAAATAIVGSAGIGGSVVISSGDGSPLEMDAIAAAQFTDTLTFTNLTVPAFLSLSEIVTPSEVASSSISSYADIYTAANGHVQCSINVTFPQYQNCTVISPIQPGGIAAYLTVYLSGAAQVNCDSPCEGGASDFVSGYKVAGGAKVAGMMVVDQAGNPIKGVEIVSASGFKYPIKFPSTTQVVSSSNPSSFGESVTFTAAVASQGRSTPPSGSVTFVDGETVLGKITLRKGSASFSTSTLASGTHSITALYSGDAQSSGSQSLVLNQVVQ